MSPYVAAIEDHTCHWVQHFTLLSEPASADRFRMARFGALAASTHPDASLDALCLLADWCSWLFILDDYCDESGLGAYPDQLAEIHRRFMAILRGAQPTPTDNALTRSLWDLRQRTMVYGTAVWMRRFVAQIEAYFAAGVWEASNRAEHVTPDATSYTAQRPYTGGLFAYVELLTATAGIQLPRHVSGHPVVQHLTRLANTLICWTNDILSYERERMQGDVHNLVLILQHEQRLTVSQAVARVTERHNAEMQEFLALEGMLPELRGEVSHALNAYVALLRSMVRGSFDWAYATARHSVAERAVAA
jgi:5-epi-alpha-selinene synthase